MINKIIFNSLNSNLCIYVKLITGLLKITSLAKIYLNNTGLLKYILREIKDNIQLMMNTSEIRFVRTKS